MLGSMDLGIWSHDQLKNPEITQSWQSPQQLYFALNFRKKLVYNAQAVLCRKYNIPTMESDF